MRRREFILGSAAAAWPMVAQAQQGGRMRRIGVLMNLAADDVEGQARVAAFQQGLQEVGLSVGRNVQIDYRWGTKDTDRRKYAAELVALTPDVLLAGASSALGALQQATQSIPIVFAQVTDPVGGGYVSNLAKPGGNTTGFALLEYGVSGKWLELLKEIAPGTRRVLVLRDPTLIAGIGQFGALQSAAPAFGIELMPIGLRDAGEIERGIIAFARKANGSLITTVGASAGAHSQLIIDLVAQHRLPAVYPFRYHVTNGGLMSYGPDTLGQFRSVARYVDRILKGENPADLPVQAPTKYELAINLKTAKTLGLTVPPTLLARADEVIE